MNVKAAMHAHTATAAPADHPVGPALVAALQAAWDDIRRRHPDVPHAVLVVASGTTGKTAKHGHYAHARWQARGAELPEVLIAGEGLARGGLGVFGTLLHEAAHGVAAARGVKDTSRGGRYHNEAFAELARELGLEVSKGPSHGWHVTEVGEALARSWAPTIVRLTATINECFRLAERMGGEGKPKSVSRNLLAECRCGRKIRASREVLEAAPITCGECGEAFETQED